MLELIPVGVHSEQVVVCCRERLTFTPVRVVWRLQSTYDYEASFWTAGGSPEKTCTYKLHTETPQLGFEPGTPRCEVRAVTTAPRSSPGATRRVETQTVDASTVNLQRVDADS